MHKMEKVKLVLQVFEQPLSYVSPLANSTLFTRLWVF